MMYWIQEMDSPLLLIPISAKGAKSVLPCVNRRPLKLKKYEMDTEDQKGAIHPGPMLRIFAHAG